MENEFNYTKDHALRILEEEYGRHVSDVTLNNVINERNFYKRGLARKELNGYETNSGETGKRWMLTAAGIKELVEICKQRKPRSTKAEMQQRREQENARKNFINTSTEIREDIYENLGIYLKAAEMTQKEYINMLIEEDLREKNEIIKQINELQKQLKRK